MGPPAWELVRGATPRCKRPAC